MTQDPGREAFAAGRDVAPHLGRDGDIQLDDLEPTLQHHIFNGIRMTQRGGASHESGMVVGHLVIADCEVARELNTPTFALQPTKGLPPFHHVHDPFDASIVPQGQLGFDDNYRSCVPAHRRWARGNI